MSQIILGPGELDDSAVSQNCPTWMTRNKFVPLAKRPESPSVRDARRLEKIWPVGHTALMESIVNMEEHEPSKLNENLYEYLRSFSPNVQDIVQNFGLQKHIEKLDENAAGFILQGFLDYLNK